MSAKSASGHVEYSFGKPCLKNLTGTRKKQNDDFENCSAQKFPGKVKCSLDKTS